VASEWCGATVCGKSAVPEKEVGRDVVKVVVSWPEGKEEGPGVMGVSIVPTADSRAIRFWCFVDIWPTGITNRGQIGETLLGLGMDYILLLLSIACTCMSIERKT
jgi:hypothetical protein